MSDLRNFSEIFRKDVTYDNTKSKENLGLHLLSRRYISAKTKERGQINPILPQPLKG